MSPTNEIKQYRIVFENRPGYLYAFVEGKKDSYEISIAYWREIAAEAERLGSTKIMVEEDIPEIVSYAEIYDISAKIPEMFNGVSVAYVDRYADQVELNSFAELVAQNRGFRGKFFTDPAAAEEWLKNL